MEEIILSNIILTSKGLNKLLANGWEFEFLYAEENHIFWKKLWVNSQTLDIYDKPYQKTQIVKVAFKIDVLLKIIDMIFVWENKQKIHEDSELGQLLSAYLLSEFEKIKYLSFEENTRMKNISDYKYCEEYITKRCIFYNIPKPEDVNIYLIEAKLWKMLLGATHAAFYPGYNIIIAPDIQWSSQNWAESLFVHEFTHAIQHKRGWLLSYKDIGLSNEEIESVAFLINQGFSIEKIADITNLNIGLLRKMSVYLSRKERSGTEYLEQPLEILAFAEQFNFLKWMGLSPEKIKNHIISYMESTDLLFASRNKGHIERMINNSDEIILQIIQQQEELNDNPLSSRSKFPKNKS